MKDGGWRVVHLDVSAPGQTLQVEKDGRAVYAIFWWGRLPLGARAFLPGELPLNTARILSLAAQMIPPQLAARCPELGAPLTIGSSGLASPRYPLAALEMTGVADLLDRFARPSECGADDLGLIICTRDRPEMLARCLQSVRAQRKPAGQVIIVDNSTGRSAETVCAGQADVIYLHEPRKGLSIARNTGVRRCSKPLIAFTDDDTELDPNWTAEIVAPFALAEVDAVTGLVLPASLNTAAKASFQLDMGGLGDRFVPITFDQRFFDAGLRRGVPVWRVGAGASMAFRRSAFERVGLFDERLGAGASGCSEDSEFWYRILASGGTCRYEPKAVVFHDHRDSWQALQRQIRAYAKGHVSALVVQYDRFGHAGNLRRIFTQLPAYYLRVGLSAVKSGAGQRLATLAQEVAGWLAGLIYLVRPGWRKIPAPRL